MNLPELPKPLSMFTDDELEDFLDSNNLNPHIDVYDKLEELRVLLNKSQCEGMHYIKKQSKFGPYCSYYQRARKIMESEESGEIFSLLDQIQKQL